MRRTVMWHLLVKKIYWGTTQARFLTQSITSGFKSKNHYAHYEIPMTENMGDC